MTLSLAAFIQSDATSNVAIKKIIFERGHQLEALYLDNDMYSNSKFEEDLFNNIYEVSSDSKHRANC